MSEMPHWLNVLMLDTKFPKPSAKSNFGKNLKFNDVFHDLKKISIFRDFSTSGMQISNSRTFHDLSLTV